jgi:hypothetical protein
MKWIWNTLGFLSITAGILGLFLPVLPTTPFVLLAAACFAKGSTRFYNKLISNEMFGEMVRDFQKGLGIKKHIKVKAITLLWLSLLFSSYLLFSNLAIGSVDYCRFRSLQIHTFASNSQIEF